MSTWSPKDPGSVEFFTVDFVRQLAPSDSIVSASCACSVLSGTDPGAAAMVQGASVISGSNVSQSIQAGVAGVRYQLAFLVSTLRGETIRFAGDFWALAPFGS